MARKLQQGGANCLAEPASLFVAGKAPALEPGELERAEAWAAALVENVAGAETDRLSKRGPGGPSLDAIDRPVLTRR